MRRRHPFLDSMGVVRVAFVRLLKSVVLVKGKVGVQLGRGRQIGALPTNFAPDSYLKLNPDLLAAGVDPIGHFVAHGRFEGRLHSLPPLLSLGGTGFDSRLSTILIVSHEASRTGAPVLALNLVQGFAGRYNVVVLLLGSGPLVDEFIAASSDVFVESFSRFNNYVASYVISEIRSRFNIKFALVNSIESRRVLQGLSDNKVPSVSLIHEFASYTRPADAFEEVFKWSGRVVFSTEITKANAFDLHPELDGEIAFVYPQGKCVVPLSASGDPGKVIGKERSLVKRMRPESCADETFVVLGAGAVHIRKGVDLFIDCAARFKRRAQGIPFKFVWIGSGYDPERDVGYSSYLLDQVQRSELGDHVIFVGETSSIEVAYGQADVFLLSSRLDPLPNVAIDAMVSGVPVVCFDRCSGIAEFLRRIEQDSSCVARYLDTDDIATKLLAFATSAGLRSKTGEIIRLAALSYFDMPNYINEIEELALSAISGSVTSESSAAQFKR